VIKQLLFDIYLQLPCFKQRLVSKVGRVVVVLDDDPTGTQCVHNVILRTDWSIDTLSEEFRRLQPQLPEERGTSCQSSYVAKVGEEYPVVYLLTNSRALTVDMAKKLYHEIAHNIFAASKRSGVPVSIVSRSDSTLRGHFPLDLHAIAEEMANDGHMGCIDGWVLMPFFEAGGRLTKDNIHYVRTEHSSGDGEDEVTFVPAALTEFAADKAFGFTRSDLRWAKACLLGLMIFNPAMNIQGCHQPWCLKHSIFPHLVVQGLGTRKIERRD
jgi:hypothetical protein